MSFSLRVTVGVVALGVTAAFVLTVLGPRAAWAGTCLDAGQHSRYTCFFTRDDGQPTHQGVCTNLTVVGDRFYMLFLPSMVQVGCRCEAKGTAKKPKFGQDNDFLCGENVNGDAAVGQVSGSAIKKGQYFSGGGGHMWTFQCEPGC
jgi:hypothetical protein